VSGPVRLFSCLLIYDGAGQIPELKAGQAPTRGSSEKDERRSIAMVGSSSSSASSSSENDHGGGPKGDS
jgi:hypothetical protein